jgi:hypothetical protein
MAVAPSYKTYKILTEPYEVNGKLYVDIEHPNTHNVRRARWYDAIEQDEPTGKPLRALKDVLGFSLGSIQIFRGDIEQLEDWFKESPCRYHNYWGWFLASEDADKIAFFPAGIEALELPWDLISKDDNTLLSENQVREAVNRLLYPDSSASWVGGIGDRIECELVVTKTVTQFNGYGKSTFHIFKDDNDNVYIWNTSAKSLPEGKRYKVRGTVKDLSFYKGQKQNVLTRCNVVEV